MGAFGEWQEAYASRSIPTFPVRIGSDGDKKPAIRGWQNVGLVASKVLGERFAGSDAFGFCAGKKSGLAVLDIDTPEEKALADALARHGETPLVVRTGSGNWQGWYRWNGEGRKIRPRRGEPVDILGSGLVVAPPSIASRRRYELVAGSLDDLKNLPTMRVGGDHLHRARGEAVGKGRRNSSLFRFCMSVAHRCHSLDELLVFARQESATYSPPMDDSEVVKTTNSAWGYEQRGENRFGILGVWLPSQTAAALAAHPFLCALIVYLKGQNGPEAEFWIANGLAEILGWSRRDFVAARNAALNSGWVQMVRPPAPKRPAVYKWGKRRTPPETLGVSAVDTVAWAE